MIHRALTAGGLTRLQPYRKLYGMDAISYTAARENLAATMDKVCQDHAPIIITRNRDQSVVMMSLDEYESLQETAYLLQSPVNANRLMKATKALDSGRGKTRKIKLGE